MYGLTKRQNDLLKYLKECEANGEVAPSFREMAKAIDLKSVSAVHCLMRGLKQRGAIDYIPSRARTVMVLK